MRSLYENIKKIRKQKKMKQNELSKLAGYSSNAMITRIEKGDIDLPYSKIETFSEVLDVSVPKLLGFCDSDIMDRINKLSPAGRDYMEKQLEFVEHFSEEIAIFQ